MAEYITLTNRLESKSKNLAEEVHKYLVAHYNQKITIDWLCDYFYVSRSTLMNTFKSQYDMTIHQFILDYRLEKSIEMLKDNNKTIQDIAIECGFNDANYFSKAFKKRYLVSPTSLKEKNTIN
ncbi:MAG: helix-turn-helix domain-containing protein [Faecalibacillus sp.]